MLKQIRPTMLLAVALTVSPLFLSTPASARPRNHYRHSHTRVVTPRRDVTPNRNVVTPNPRSRVVRLSNGDVRLPNGQVVSSRRLVRLRNQGYWRLPNGDFILPNQEIVPVRNTVRMQNGRFRLPNGVILII